MNSMHKIKGESMMGHPVDTTMLPSFSVTTKDLPEAKDWKVGNKYVVKMEIILTSQSRHNYDFPDMNKDTRCGFDIVKIGLEDSNSEEEKSGKKGYD